MSVTENAPDGLTSQQQAENIPDHELVNLNVVMTYPVKWNPYKIINNYVQNFYDALGPHEFQRSFHYEYSDGTLMMSSDRGFAKEWLYYMGASTKRGNGTKYAGGFGEGFKIAALTSIRDFGLSVDMESRDWTLRAVRVPGEIDGQAVEFLAYETGSRPFQENALLRLGNVPEDFLTDVEYVISHFYYEGNPLFGKCLAQAEDYAIYEAVQNPRNRQAFGHVFASYQKRNTIYVPLVICNHRYKPDEDDRDRDDLSSYQTQQCIIEVFRKLDAQTSLNILRYFRSVWKGWEKRGYHRMDWIPVMHVLIWNIRSTPLVVKQFQEEYLSQLIIRDQERHEQDVNRRRMALWWFQQNPIRTQYHQVHDVFLPLGVKTICQLCEEMDGYTAERDPDSTESEQIRILRTAAQDILGDLIVVHPWPGCRILLNEKAPVAGYTKIIRHRGKKNRYGLQVTAKADYVYLQSWLLEHGTFGNAFATYAHELLHAYGGDTSIHFHKALYYMNQLIIRKMDRFACYKECWEHVRAH